MFRQFLLLLLFPFALQAQTYSRTTLLTGLDRPVAFDFAPDGRTFLTLKGGITGPAVNAQIRVYDANYNDLGVFYDLSDSTDSDYERGLIGIAIDPDFVNTHYVFAFYVHLRNGDEHLRIVRLTDVNNTGTNPRVIFDIDVPDTIPGVHVGGNLHFRPSEPDKIYFTVGDLGSNQTDTALNYAHKLNNPFGKTLRINKDGTIPSDNPFYDDGNIYTGTCDIIWSYGHRNAFDFCFSPVNDSFYVSENGLITWDEVNQIHKGKDYGWNECEGLYKNSSVSVLCDDAGSVLPMTTWGAPLGGVTGILFYNDTTMPEFNNHLLVADIDYGHIYDLALGNPPAYDVVSSNVIWTMTPDSGGITTIRKGAEGCVYALNGGYTTNGKLYRICPGWMSIGEHQAPDFEIQQNYPNPFSGSSTIRYSTKPNTALKIILYDASGRALKVLYEGTEPAGEHELKLDQAALQLAPGTYFCAFRSENSVKVLAVSVLE